MSKRLFTGIWAVFFFSRSPLYLSIYLGNRLSLSMVCGVVCAWCCCCAVVAQFTLCPAHTHRQIHSHRTRTTDIKWKMYEFQWKFYEYFTLYLFPHFPPMPNSTNRQCFYHRQMCNSGLCLSHFYTFLALYRVHCTYVCTVCVYVRSQISVRVASVCCWSVFGKWIRLLPSRFAFGRVVNCELYGKSMFHLNKTRRQMRWQGCKWGKWKNKSNKREIGKTATEVNNIELNKFSAFAFGGGSKPNNTLFTLMHFFLCLLENAIWNTVGAFNMLIELR